MDDGADLVALLCLVLELLFALSILAIPRSKVHPKMKILYIHLLIKCILYI